MELENCDHNETELHATYVSQELVISTLISFHENEGWRPILIEVVEKRFAVRF